MGQARPEFGKDRKAKSVDDGAAPFVPNRPFEGRAGAPFVGPAGSILDRALEETGTDRGAVNVTNAVKHFKWRPRSSRRLHQTPCADRLGGLVADLMLGSSSLSA